MASSTAKKPSAASKKPALSKAVPLAVVADAGDGAGKLSKAELLKKKDLIEQVVALLDGRKKGGVKEVIDATLTVLGAALQKGHSLNLPPLGKARVARSKGEGSSAALTVKLREAGQKKSPGPAKESLADTDEDS